MRTKQVQIEDEVYTICPLSLAQTIAMLKKNSEIKFADGEKPTSEEADAMLGIMYDVICDSFNNAERTLKARCSRAFDPSGWTRERVLAEIDQRAFSQLHDEIMTLSDLRRAKVGEAGELQGHAPNGASATAPSTGTK